MAQLNEISLEGRTVLITRPANQSKNLCDLIRSGNGNAISFPVIEILPKDDPDLGKDLPQLLARTDMMIFVSSNAVRYFDLLVPAASSDPHSVARRVRQPMSLARWAQDRTSAEDTRRIP